MDETVAELKRRLERFETAAHAMLAMHEGSKSRVFNVGETRRKLQVLSVTQSDLLEQSIGCIEHGLNRPAIVMAWAAFVDFLTTKLFEDGFIKLHVKYPAWAGHVNPEQLRENINEFSILDAGEALALYGKPDNKTLKGLLSQRNQAAHPGSQNPTTSVSLGYLARLIQFIEVIDTRSV